MNEDWCGIVNFEKRVSWDETCFSNSLDSKLDFKFGETRKSSRSPNTEAYFYTENNCVVLFSGKPFVNLSPDSEIQGKKVIHSYHSAGDRFFENLDGHFSLLLIDLEAQIVLFGVDRFGIGALTYGLIDGTLHFSTDLQIFTAGDNQKHSLSSEGIFLFFDFNMIPPPWTIYTDVKKVEPGQYVVYKNSTLITKPYHHLIYTEDNFASEEELAQEFNKRLTKSFIDLCAGLPRNCLGSTLSGGVDSSTMVGFLTSQLNSSAKTFSIGFEEKECNELPYAHITANHFKAKAYEYIVQPDDIFEVIDNVVDTFGEPYGNSSAIPTYFCGKLASDNGVKYLVSGDGGDELFGGNERYLTNKIFNTYMSVPHLLRALLEVPLGQISSDNRFIKRVQNFVSRANLENPARFFSDDSFGSKYPTELYTSTFLNSVKENVSIVHITNLFESAQAKSELNKLLHIDMFDTLAGNDIPKVRTMFKAAGVTPIFPMLHPAMVDFALSLPEDQKLKGRQKRYLQKKAVRGFIPDAIQTKPKQGFGLPVGRWLREQPKVKDFFYDILFSSTLAKRDILNPDFIKKLASDHQSGSWDNSYYLWSLLIFELWMKKFIDKNTI